METITPPLPDPDEFPDRDVVIFDGKCRFCIGQIKNLRRFDCIGSRLAYFSLHDQRVAERYSDLSYDDLMAQMYIINQAGDRFGGGDAVKYLTRRLPLLWPVMPLFHIPGTAGLLRWAYMQVAKRRYKIAGKLDDCGDQCAVHFGPPKA